MFSYFQNIYQGMAFTTDKNRYARSACAKHAEAVLNDYLRGQEKAYAVRQVMDELRALFHVGAVLPCSLIESALLTDDEDAKAGAIARALHMIEKQVLSDRVTSLND